MEGARAWLRKMGPPHPMLAERGLVVDEDPAKEAAEAFDKAIQHAKVGGSVVHSDPLGVRDPRAHTNTHTNTHAHHSDSQARALALAPFSRFLPPPFARAYCLQW